MTMLIFGLLLMLLCCECSVDAVVTVDVPGDVQLGAINKIWNSSVQKCSAIDIVSVRIYEAIKWTLKTLNAMDFVPGIQIGLTAKASCNVEGEALQAAMDLVGRSLLDAENSLQSRIPIIGLIGPEYSSEAESISHLISSLQHDDQLLQVLYSATASSLSDTTRYKNIRRVIPSDSTQVQAIVSFLKELQWNYIGIIYDDNAYGRGGFQSLTNLLKSENICIAKSFPISIGKQGEISYSKVKDIVRSLVRHSESSITGVVMFSATSTVTSFLSALESERSSIQFSLSVLLSEGVGLNSKVFETNTNIANGFYNTVPHKVEVEEFLLHWKKILTNTSYLLEEAVTNPWLYDVIESLTNCRPSNDTNAPKCTLLTPSAAEEATSTIIHEYYAMVATIAQASVLKQLHHKTCPLPGICDPLKDILYKSKGRLITEADDITIQTDKDLLTSFPHFNISFSNGNVDAVMNNYAPEYELYQYRQCVISNSLGFCFEKIGNYSLDKTHIDAKMVHDFRPSTTGSIWPDVNRAQCAESSKCMSCIRENLPNDVFFIEGDVYVVGIIPFYNGDPDNLLECGSLTDSSLMQISLAMTNVVQRVNTENLYFPNKTIGLVLINTCNQPLLCETKLIYLLQGNLILRNGSAVDISKQVLGFVGSLSSSDSLACANVLTRFKHVQVSYASTSSTLSDREQFPYFLRTPTPDDKQVLTMLKIIEDMDSNFIQVIYSSGVYGEGGYNRLQTEAKLREICVVSAVKIEYGKYTIVKDKLRKEPFAKIVVIFVQSYMLHGLLSDINSWLDDEEFVFIASEALGHRDEFLKNRIKLNNMLTLSLEMNASIGLHDVPFHDIVKMQDNHPWLKPHLEKKYHCYFDGAFDKSSPSKCPAYESLLQQLLNEKYHWTPFAANAMLAMIGGANQAFTELCGPKSTQLCDSYRSNPDKVYEYTKTHALYMDGTNIAKRVFDENGDGSVGYNIYQARRQTSDTRLMEFVWVGESRSEEDSYNLDLTVKAEFSRLNSNCPNQKACAACLPEITTHLPLATSATPHSQINTTVLVAFSCATCSLILITGVLTYKLCRHKRKTSEPEGHPYITPIHLENHHNGPITNETPEDHYDNVVTDRS